MAYTLHLLAADFVTNAVQAEAFVDSQRELEPLTDDAFSAFIADITRIYPDLTESDTDGDDEENLWEEGLSEETSYGQVMELALKEDLVDERVVARIAKVAKTQGLKLYDSEGIAVY